MERTKSKLMAITKNHYRILQQLRDRNVLPKCERVLNIGQPNWHGDRIPVELEFACNGCKTSFEKAEAIYREVLGCDEYISIDMHGPDALKMDLNQPIDAYRTFHFVANHGTAEHIFNIAQVFRTMHDHCAKDWFMLHEGPFTGWLEHGFYNLQPTLFYDLAIANRYEIVIMAVQDLVADTLQFLGPRSDIEWLIKDPPANGLWFVLYKKTTNRPFMIPMQDVYADYGGDPS